MLDHLCDLMTFELRTPVLLPIAKNQNQNLFGALRFWSVLKLYAQRIDGSSDCIMQSGPAMRNKSSVIKGGNIADRLIENLFILIIELHQLKSRLARL